MSALRTGAVEGWEPLAGPDRLPALASVLSTATDALLPTNPADQEQVAVCRLADGRVALFALTSEGEATAVMLSRLRMARLEVSARYIVTEQTLAVIYGRRAVMRVVTSRRDAADELLDNIIGVAVEAGASDIHLDGERASMSILQRVDGELAEVRSLSDQVGEELVRAIWRRLTKDGEWQRDAMLQGAMTRAINGREFRVRFQQLPNARGSMDVRMRLLPLSVSSEHVPLTALGLLPDQVNAINAALDHPRGAVLLAGVMGSGKSTSLKSMLEYVRLQRPGACIQTFEDPVEYLIDGTRQTMVYGNIANADEDERAWNEALAALVRSDANVVMLGEIRNKATATAAQQLNLIGLKLFGTLHAVDPFLTLARLAKLGYDVDVLTAPGAISAVIRQQLVPLVCPECGRDPETAKAQKVLSTAAFEGLRAFLERDIPSSVRFRGPGCSHCAGKGLKGRSVIADLLFPTERTMQHFRDGELSAMRTAWEKGEDGVPRGLLHHTALRHARARVLNGSLCPSSVDRLLVPLRTLA